MSLKALARERLAALRESETAPETNVKQEKQGGGQASGVFHEAARRFALVKHENPQESAENGACFTVSPPRAGNGETRAIPADLAAGLDLLRKRSAPRITRPRVWPQIVADAVRLVSEGWAAQALGLGWQPVHLWGCSPDKGGCPDHDGLAVILDGRRVLLLDAESAIVEAASGGRVVFTRRAMPGAILLWDIGGPGS